ncbi:HMP/thiamine-binding protein, partial [Rhizobium leguminosarum]
PDILFAAMHDLFVAAAKTGEHCLLSAAISRGCPGEPDDAICGVNPSLGVAEAIEGLTNRGEDRDSVAREPGTEILGAVEGAGALQ